MITIIFLFLLLIYSIRDFQKKEVEWSLLLIGVFFMFFVNFLLFLLIFGVFYLIYQFVNIGGADVLVLAMICAVLGVKIFIMYLVVL